MIDRAIWKRWEELPGTGSASLLVNIIELFLQTADAQVTDIQNAFARGDAASVALQSHSLKSSCLSLGAIVMAELCTQIEKEAKAGTLKGKEHLIAKLAEEYHSVSDELHDALPALAA